MIVPYRPFGTVCQFPLQRSNSPRTNSWTGPLKKEPINCPETSVRNHHSSLHKISKELRSHLHHIILCMLAGAIRVDNYPRKYRRSNSRGRWSWWPKQWQPRISNNYLANQEIIWVYPLRMFVTLFTKAYNSILTWATSIPSLTSHSTSSRSPALYLPIYAFFRLHQSLRLLGCDAVYFDRRL
jgi:hypothetical protein